MRSTFQCAATLLGLLLASLALVVGASAETVTFGLGLGPAIRSQGGTALGFEIKGGYRFLPMLATNLYYWRVSSGADVTDSGSSISSSSALSGFGGEALYGFAGSNWSVGGKLGLMKNSISGTATGPDGSSVKVDGSSSSLAIAPTVIYELPLGTYFSVGGEAAYFFTLSSSVPKALSLMAVGRVRF